MSRPRINRRMQEEQHELQARRRLVVQLWIVLAFALLMGAIAGIIAGWDRLFPVAPEQLVTIYWTHDCRCAAPWIRSLEADGFRVRDFELETLGPIRRGLGTPKSLRGCHVAAFMGYFVEGHVRADTLRRLAQEHPGARGVVLAGDAVRLFDHRGSPRTWLIGELDRADTDGDVQPLPRK